MDDIFAKAGIPQIWSRLTGMGATLVLMSPFLWAVAVKNVNKERIKKMFETWHHSQVVVIPLLILRYFIALFFVGLVVGSYFSLAIGFLLVIAVMVMLAVLYSRRANGFYAQIEDRFFSNFNQRQAQNSFHIPTAMEDEFAMERLQVTQYSPLAGKTLADGQLRERYGANIVTIERAGQIIDLPGREEILMPCDILTVIGTEEEVAKVRPVIEVEPEILIHDHSDHELHMYRYHVDAHGPLCGVEVRYSTLSKQRAIVIAIERGGQKIVNPSRDEIFLAGDILWFVSPEGDLTLKGFENKLVKI